MMSLSYSDVVKILGFAPRTKNIRTRTLPGLSKPTPEKIDLSDQAIIEVILSVTKDAYYTYAKDNAEALLNLLNNDKRFLLAGGQVTSEYIIPARNRSASGEILHIFIRKISNIDEPNGLTWKELEN